MRSDRTPGTAAARHDSVAIVGMACRFPGGADNPEAFWSNLENGVDAVTEVPPSRWSTDRFYDPDPEALGKSVSCSGAFLSTVDEFDARFFGIPPRTAKLMDPQQRLLLEVAWEAVENAGWSADSLKGSNAGVFVGLWNTDYWTRVMSREYGRFNGYEWSGNMLSSASGRISYFLGLEGPSLTVDTACSTSLVTTHLACQSLRLGECDMALAGGVNLLLSPGTFVALSRSKMIGPSGYCKSFDAAADGYARGEGCGVVVLKRYSDAVAQGDRILAIIRGTASNSDGRDGGMVVPSERAQMAVIRRALSAGGVDPLTVHYVEAHGTGTKVGDPTEMKAIGRVYCEGRPKDDPLIVGSVKTNIAHLETASGVAALIKTVLAMQHATIPRNLHFHTPNPNIPWEDLSVEVPVTNRPWRSGAPRLAGVSSFGASGTNAHVVLEEGPRLIDDEASAADPAFHILPLSAKTRAALNVLARRYQAQLERRSEALTDFCYTASTGRAHFRYRLAAVGADREELLGSLRAAKREKAREDGPDIAFLFAGQGAQYPEMGAELYGAFPVFREAIDRCDAILRDRLEVPLVEVLYPGASAAARIDSTGYTQPALFALGYALAELWRSWGIEPSAVMGHSVGEYVAAWLAGVFCLEDALTLIAERGRLMERLPRNGKMATVFASEKRVSALLSSQSQVGIAAVNGPENVVLSGERAAVDEVLAVLSSERIHSIELVVSHAFHSPLMEPMVAEFETFADKIRYRAPTLPFVSNVTGELAGDEIATGKYWAEHLRRPVRFSDGIEAIARRVSTFLELGPKTTLSSLGRASLAAAPSGRFTWLASLKPGVADSRQILESLSALYASGARVDWEGFHGAQRRRKVVLPNYPFLRQRFWVDDDELSVRSQSQSPASESLPPRIVPSPERGPHPGSQARDDETLDGSGDASAEDWISSLEWEARPRKNARPPGRSGKPASYVIFSDAAGLGSELAARLRARGDHALVVRPGEAFGETAPGAYILRPSVYEDYERLLEQTQVHGAPPLRSVVHLWSLDSSLPDGATTEVLDRVCFRILGTAVYVSRALARRAVASASTARVGQGERLWLVTRDAAAAGESGLPSLAPSLLWGFGRAASLEIPDRWGGLIDLGREAVEASAERLLAEIDDSEGEDQIALPPGQRLVARLRPRPLADAPQLALAPDATYLVTGGLGALGLHAARWLVQRGARQLVLVGRRGGRTADESSEVREALDALESAGCRVRSVAADVSRSEDVERLFRGLAELPRLRGVVHCAGVSEFLRIEELSWSDVDRSLRSKVRGVWNLDRFTGELDLDFFVCFSSVSSVWGTEGGSHYAAANHFLDTFAVRRRAQGGPVSSINWGPWASGGMASESFLSRLSLVGVEALPPDASMALLDRILASSRSQTVVAKVDWPKFREIYELRGRRPLLERMSGDPEPGGRPGEVHRPSSVETSGKTISVYLREQVARLLGFEDPAEIDAHATLIDLGFDSLMAVRLRNAIQSDLGIEVPVGDFFVSSSIEMLGLLLTENRALDEVAVVSHLPAEGVDVEIL